MKTRLYIFVFVAFVIPGLTENLRAQEMPEQVGHDGVMTLRDCMEYAISNSTKIRIQQAATGDAQISRRDAALALFTPQISTQTYAYYNFGRSIDPQTNTYFNTKSFHNNYGVSASYDLFDGFKAVNNYKISKTGMLIADSQEKQVEADICLAVMEAYYNVVYYKRLCDVYEEQVAVAEQALAKARRQEELGQKGHADVIQMEADLADRNYELINTRNMYEQQRMTLADLMFWPMDEELAVDTSIPELQEEPVAANAVVSLVLFFLSPPSVLGHYVGAARTATENIFEHLLRFSIWLLLIPMILRGGKKSGIFGIASACLSVVYVVLVFVRYGLYPRAWCGNMSLEIAVRICYCFAITLLLFLFSYSLPNYKAIAAVKKIETNQNYDITDKLLHLKELRDKGILTEEEYEDKKKQLLET